MKKVQKLLSLLAAICMLLGLFPTTVAFAAPIVVPETQTQSGVSWEILNDKAYVYANGVPIMVMKDGFYSVVETVKDGKTIYEKGTECYLPISTITKVAGAFTSTGDIERIFGGRNKSTDPVNSTCVVVGSDATLKRIYGGNNERGTVVTGQTKVIVNEGGHCNTIYGASNYGTVGSVRVEVNNTRTELMGDLYGGGWQCDVNGDITVLLNNPKITTFGGSSNNAGKTKGNIDVTINGGSFKTYFAGAGSSGAVGATIVEKSIIIRINGDTAIKDFFPMRRITNDSVKGISSIYVPEGYPYIDKIKTTYGNGSTSPAGSYNKKIYIYEGGKKIYPIGPTYDDENQYVFANGAAVLLKTDVSDQKTYVYDSAGTEKLFSLPVDNWTIFGGSPTEAAKGTSVTLESGKVAAIYGGGLNGAVIGNTFVNVKGGVTESVYAGGLNEAVSGTGQIKIGDGATVTGSVYANNVDKAAKAVVWVTKNFYEKDGNKIKQGNNVRMFIDYAEFYGNYPTVTKEIYAKGNALFANGIDILIKEAPDSRTYVYDSTGTTKLFASEVNGMEIFGGSYQGVVVGDTNVTMESGTVNRIYGGGYTGGVTGTAKITVTGGDISELIYGGSYDGDVGSVDIRVTGPYIAKGVTAGSRNGCVLGDTKVWLKDNVGKGLYAGSSGSGRGEGFPTSDVLGNASYTLIGGEFENLYSGCFTGVMHGASTINLEGNVIVRASINPKCIGVVKGGITLNIPGNIYEKYQSKIVITGMTINKTADAVIPAEPQYTVQTEKVMSTEGDSGKLVFRFINIPEPNGALTGRPGESYLITFPNGENMLIDAGADTDWSQNIITNFLDELKVTKLDYVVASHFHVDHIGRMAKILGKYNIGTLYTPGYNSPLTNGFYTDMRKWMTTPENVSKCRNLWRGEQLTIGGVTIDVLNPRNDAAEIAKMNTGPTEEEYNNNSIVLKMTYGKNTALLTGDIYTAKEDELIKYYKGTDMLKAELLKIPHHGDTTSSDPEFVLAVSPKIAVMPHFRDTHIVSKRYTKVGADTYVLGENGIVKVTFDGVNKGNVTLEKYIDVPVPPSDDATLSSLVINGAVLEPAFASGTYNYKAIVANSVSSVGVIPTVSSAVYKSLTVNAAAINSGDSYKMYLNEGVNTVTVEVAAENGNVQLYTVEITREKSSGSTDGGSSPGTTGGGEPPVIVPPATSTITGSVIKVKKPILDAKSGEAKAVIESKAISDALAQAKANAEGVKTITVEIPKVEGATAYTAVLPSTALTTVGAAQKVELKTEAGNLAIPSNMLANANVGTDKEIGITIGIGDKGNLTEEVKSQVGNRPVIEIYVIADGKRVEYNNPEAPVTVAIPYKPTAEELKDPEHIVVFYIDGQGKAVPIPNGRYDAATGTVTFTTVHFSQYAVAYVFKTFEDIADYAWAKKSIEVMASKGIINGVSQISFAPGSNIKRADFTMLLVKSLGLTAKADSDFTDVSKDAYYYEAIGIAKKFGLVKGLGDNTFAPEAEITRQEMFVIAARAMKAAKKLSRSGTDADIATFTDKAEIADYAVSDIATLVKEGIVKGSDSRVNPLGNTTRAEAAVLIYRLYNK